jgi:hypothetical protein
MVSHDTLVQIALSLTTKTCSITVRYSTTSALSDEPCG